MIGKEKVKTAGLVYSGIVVTSKGRMKHALEMWGHSFPWPLADGESKQPRLQVDLKSHSTAAHNGSQSID